MYRSADMGGLFIQVAMEGVSGGALAQAKNVYSDSSIVQSVFCEEFGGTAPHLGDEQCILIEATGSCSDNQGSPESRMS